MNIAAAAERKLKRIRRPDWGCHTYLRIRYDSMEDLESWGELYNRASQELFGEETPQSVLIASKDAYDFHEYAGDLDKSDPDYVEEDPECGSTKANAVGKLTNDQRRKFLRFTATYCPHNDDSVQDVRDCLLADIHEWMEGSVKKGKTLKAVFAEEEEEISVNPIPVTGDKEYQDAVTYRDLHLEHQEENARAANELQKQGDRLRLMTQARDCHYKRVQIAESDLGGAKAEVKLLRRLYVDAATLLDSCFSELPFALANANLGNDIEEFLSAHVSYIDKVERKLPSEVQAKPGQPTGASEAVTEAIEQCKHSEEAHIVDLLAKMKKLRG